MLIARWASCSARFWRDERGIVLPLATVIIVPLVLMAALATDMSRMFNGQSELQKSADAFALAAAAELDGQSTAIDRARAAITALMQARNTTEQTAIAPGTITFYESLPTDQTLRPSDDVSMASWSQTTNARDARYVRVTVRAAVQTVFPMALFGMGGSSLQTEAEAVAGTSLVVCDSVVMLMCDSTLDYEGNPIKFSSGRVSPGTMVRMHGSSGTSLAAGNFGWLDYGTIGTPALNKLVGSISPFDQCVAKSKNLQTNPGVRAVVSDYFNTRFELGQIGTSYPPAPSVRKSYLGTGGSACNLTPVALKSESPNGEADLSANDIFVKLPEILATDPRPTIPLDINNVVAVDLPIKGGPNPSFDGPIVANVAFPLKNGKKDEVVIKSAEFPSYWSAIGVSTAPLISSDPIDTPNSKGARYKAYEWEINNTNETNISGKIPGLKQLPGTPVCNFSAAGKDRRLTSVAITNCNDIGGATPNFPIIGTAQLFLVRPLKNTGTYEEVFAEFQNFTSIGSSTRLSIAPVTKLYR